MYGLLSFIGVKLVFTFHAVCIVQHADVPRYYCAQTFEPRTLSRVV